MTETTLEGFRAELLAKGAYRTADDHRAPKRARPGALTTLMFSLGVLKTVPRCALYEPFGS